MPATGALASVALLWRPTIIASLMALTKKDKAAAISRALPTRKNALRGSLLAALLLAGPYWRRPFHVLLARVLGGTRTAFSVNSDAALAENEDERLRAELGLGRRSLSFREGFRRALMLLLLQLWGGAGSDAALPEFLVILGVGASLRKLIRRTFHRPDPVSESASRRERRRRRNARHSLRDEVLSQSESEPDADYYSSNELAGNSSAIALASEKAKNEDGRARARAGSGGNRGGRLRAPSLARARARSRERKAVRDRMPWFMIGASRAQLWRWVKSELAIFLEPALHWRESSLARFNLGVSVLMSSCMMFMFHETPQFYQDGYARFLRIINGAPQPVYNLWRKPNGLIPASGIEKSVPSLYNYLWHLKRGTLHCLRLLLVLDCTMRPIFRGRLPTWREPLGAIRSAFWMTFAGSFGVMAGWMKIAGHPHLTTLIRCAWGGIGSFSSIIMDVDGFDNISDILMGQFAFTVLGAFGAYVLRLSDKRTVLAPHFAVIIPALGEIGLIPKTPLAGLLLKPFGALPH